MKAMILNQFNTPFQLADLPMPEITSQQVLVRIVASGINPIDLQIRAGMVPFAQVQTPNAVLGTDMSGIIVEVGKDVEDFNVGEAVFGMAGGVAGIQGTLAEYVAADPALLAKKPDQLSFKEAAALPLYAITAWEAIVERGAVRKKESVLIQGGAGGVGQLAIQIAQARGAEVFATGTSKQANVIRELGAWPIDFESQFPQEYVNELTNNQGFDTILDTVGGDVLDASFESVKRYTGRVVSLSGWGEHSLSTLSFRGASFSGIFALYPLISGIGRARQGKILADVAMLVSTGKLRPMVSDLDLPLEAAEEAYRYQEFKQEPGKVTVSISNP